MLNAQIVLVYLMLHKLQHPTTHVKLARAFKKKEVFKCIMHAI